MGKVVRLRVSLVGFSGLYRVLDAASDATFEDLHEAIFAAFNRGDPHLYSFYMTGADTKSRWRIRQSPQICSPDAGAASPLAEFARSGDSAAEVRIGDAELEPDDVFHYLFDFGDEWWHRIRVQETMESHVAKRSVVLVKSVGGSPPQYSDFG